jgi:hypothetical protein
MTAGFWPESCLIKYKHIQSFDMNDMKIPLTLPLPAEERYGGERYGGEWIPDEMQ